MVVASCDKDRDIDLNGIGLETEIVGPIRFATYTSKNTVRTRWFCQTALHSLTASLCTELICLLSMKAKVSY
jgi:hypothetical protein